MPTGKLTLLLFQLNYETDWIWCSHLLYVPLVGRFTECHHEKLMFTANMLKKSLKSEKTEIAVPRLVWMRPESFIIVLDKHTLLVTICLKYSEKGLIKTRYLI